MTIVKVIDTISALVKNEEEAIARAEAYRKRAIELTREAIEKQVRLNWRYIGDSQEHAEWFLAYLYWNVPELTAMAIADLFDLKGIQSLSKIAQKNQLHGITCTRCGDVLFIKSRSDLTYKDHNWRAKAICDDCREAEYSVKRPEQERQQAEREARQDLLHTMPYAEYLQSPEWQAIRLRKLKRAHFACELCLKRGTLHVHHKTYERRGNEIDSDLIVLCADCHAKFHDKLPKE